MPRRAAIRLVQTGEPNGWPRAMLCRRAWNSAWVCGAFTNRIQSAGRSTGPS